jgi:hypothetical protein
LSKLKGATAKAEIETTKATARLPNLHVEIGHWRSPGGDSEQISITLQAVPSFAEFGRFLEAANPFALWAQALRLAWFPWQAAARLAELPAAIAASSLPRPPSEVDADFAETGAAEKKRRSPQ